MANGSLMSAGMGIRNPIGDSSVISCKKWALRLEGVKL